MTATPETLIADRYRLRSLIAVGGMGEVWRATDERLTRPVAIKLLKPEYGAEPAFLARFRAEARHAAGLSHPGIAAVFDYGEVQEDGRTVAYLVMELVEGEPLSHLLARRHALPPALALQIVGQAGVALQAAHEAGVIHRDVKPGNLIVIGADGDPDEVVVKVTDFGIARAVDSAPLTRTGMVMGTAHYLSPEQARAGTVTPASDVYALGVVAYECLAGRRPFTGDTAVAIAAAHAHQPPPPLPADVPPDVRALVEYAMAKEPAARPRSAGAFGRSALALAAAHGSTPASSSSTPAETATQPIARVAEWQDRDAPATRLMPSVAGAPPTQVIAEPLPAAEPGGHRVWPWLVALVVLVVLGLAGWALSSDLSGNGSPTPTTTPATHTSTASPKPTTSPATHTTSPKPTTTTAAPTTTTAPTAVEVRESDYVGRTYDDAAAALRRLGLVPAARSVTSGGTPGSVTGVSPTGRVPLGRTVTLDVVASPAPTTAASTAAPSSAAGSSAGASSSAQAGAVKGNGKTNGNGQGNGQGNGKGKGNGGHGG